MNYKRIDKRIARRYCIGATCEVYAVPCKLNPASPWLNGGALISKLVLDGFTFESAVAHVEYFHCSNETGKYLAFYVKE